MTCGTYTITNMITNDWYAGQSPNIEKRWRNHRNGYGSNTHLQNSAKKYGWEYFVFRIEEVCEHDKQKMDAAEQKLLDLHPTFNKSFIASRVDPKFLIGNKFAKGNKFSLTDEQKKKISEGLKGNKCFLGHKHTEEWKTKMSNSNKGKSPPAATIEAARKYHLGSKQSEETKKKISMSLIETMKKKHSVSKEKEGVL